jgi:hypothetical protein
MSREHAFQITSNLAVKSELHIWDECIYDSLSTFSKPLWRHIQRLPTEEASPKLSAFISLLLNKQSRRHLQSRLVPKPPAAIGPSLLQDHTRSSNQSPQRPFYVRLVGLACFIRLWRDLAGGKVETRKWGAGQLRWPCTTPKSCPVDGDVTKYTPRDGVTCSLSTIQRLSKKASPHLKACEKSLV